MWNTIMFPSLNMKTLMFKPRNPRHVFLLNCGKSDHHMFSLLSLNPSMIFRTAHARLPCYVYELRKIYFKRKRTYRTEIWKNLDRTLCYCVVFELESRWGLDGFQAGRLVWVSPVSKGVEEVECGLDFMACNEMPLRAWWSVSKGNIANKPGLSVNHLKGLLPFNNTLRC